MNRSLSQGSCAEAVAWPGGTGARGKVRGSGSAMDTTWHRRPVRMERRALTAMREINKAEAAIVTSYFPNTLPAVRRNRASIEPRRDHRSAGQFLGTIDHFRDWLTHGGSTSLSYPRWFPRLRKTRRPWPLVGERRSSRAISPAPAGCAIAATILRTAGRGLCRISCSDRVVIGVHR